MSCNLTEFCTEICNDSEAILSRISALCPGGQTFLLQKHLKEFANHIHFSENDLKHEITLAKNLLWKELKLPSTPSEANSLSLEQFFSFTAT